MRSRSGIRSHHDLIVWRKAIELVVVCYRCASRLPIEERFGLAAQIRRAAVSVPANIAEGHGRRSRRDYARFVAIARGSLMELETHLVVSERLGLLDRTDTSDALALIAEISRMLSGLRARLSGATKAEP